MSLKVAFKYLDYPVSRKTLKVLKEEALRHVQEARLRLMQVGKPGYVKLWKNGKLIYEYRHK